jgi:hypothetical protein
LRRSFFTQRRVMLDFFPEVLVRGEEPGYAFRPRASAKRAWSSPISAKDPGAELDTEPGEAQKHVSVRVLRESLFHRLREIVGGRACGRQLDHESEHLLAECVLDQGRLVGVVAAEDVTQPVSLSVDAASAAGSPECGLNLCSGQPRGLGGCRCGLEEFTDLGSAQAVGPGGGGLQGGTHGTLFYAGAEVLPPVLISGTDRFTPSEGESAAKELHDRLLALPTTEPIAYRRQNSGDYDHNLVLRPDVAPGLTGLGAHLV